MKQITAPSPNSDLEQTETDLLSAFRLSPFYLPAFPPIFIQPMTAYAYRTLLTFEDHARTETVYLLTPCSI